VEKGWGFGKSLIPSKSIQKGRERILAANMDSLVTKTKLGEAENVAVKEKKRRTPAGGSFECRKTNEDGVPKPNWNILQGM